MPRWLTFDVFEQNDVMRPAIPALVNVDRLLMIGQGDAPTRIEGVTRKITILQISETAQLLSPMDYENVVRIISKGLD